MGGDLINFSKKVKFVNGVEINPENFAILQQNCCSFGCKNVNLFCQDYTAIYDKLKQDIIYIDPPWGGIGYKSKEFVSLKLGGMELYELINLITIKSLAKFVIIKAPLNVCLDQIDYGHITVVYNKSRVPTFKIICVNVLKQCLKSKHLK
jgi:16S rRNA G966 N2-methylase RsmD